MRVKKEQDAKPKSSFKRVDTFQSQKNIEEDIVGINKSIERESAQKK